MALDKHLQAFHDWRGSVRSRLARRHIRPQDVAFGEWRFDWYQSFVAGCRPYEAIEDALSELRDRGLLTDEGMSEEYTDFIKTNH